MHISRLCAVQNPKRKTVKQLYAYNIPFSKMIILQKSNVLRTHICFSFQLFHFTRQGHQKKGEKGRSQDEAFKVGKLSIR